MLLLIILIISCQNIEVFLQYAEPPDYDSPQFDIVLHEIDNYTNTSFWISWEQGSGWSKFFYDYHYCIIKVTSLWQTYYVPLECEQNEPKTFYYNVSSTNNTTFQFTQALPRFRYEVTIKATTNNSSFTFESVNKYVITRRGIPEAPRDTNFTLLNFTSEEKYNVSVVVNWKYPCLTNGPVSHFHIEIIGKSNVGDQIEDHLDKKNVSVNNLISNLNYEYTLEHLKPAFLYRIFIRMVTEENLKGTPKLLQFISYESFPEAPTIKSILNVTKSTFAIEWDKPKETRGRLQKYVVHVDSAPRYYVPKECSVNQTDTAEIPADTDNFTYQKGMPYHRYNVFVTAINGIGTSPLSEVLVTNTLEAEPEEVRNLRVELEYSETKEYSALVKIYFDYPCHTYGPFQGIYVILIDSKTEEQINNYNIKEVSERYNRTFLDLSPERTYTILVRVHTRAFKSEGITHGFITNAGNLSPREQIVSKVLCFFVAVVHVYMTR